VKEGSWADIHVEEYGEQTSEIEQLKALCLQHNIPLPSNIDIFI